jgi:hypothetical protein
LLESRPYLADPAMITSTLGHIRPEGWKPGAGAVQKSQPHRRPLLLFTRHLPAFSG